MPTLVSMFIRNPFKRTFSVATKQDDFYAPTTQYSEPAADAADFLDDGGAFAAARQEHQIPELMMDPTPIPTELSSERLSHKRNKPSLALNLKSKPEKNEFKLSVVNDSGVYLPVSPFGPISMFPFSFVCPQMHTQERRKCHTTHLLSQMLIEQHIFSMGKIADN
jgi:hypothetical protein